MNSDSIQSVEDMDLAEDSFHAKDFMSMHIKEQRDKDVNEKREKADRDREERKKEADPNTEFIEPEDFRPGGKYGGSESEEARERRLRREERLAGEAQQAFARGEIELAHSYVKQTASEKIIGSVQDAASDSDSDDDGVRTGMAVPAKFASSMWADLL